MCVNWCESLETAGRVYHWLEVPEGFFLLLAMKIERRSRDRVSRSILAANNRKKPCGTQSRGKSDEPMTWVMMHAALSWAGSLLEIVRGRSGQIFRTKWIKANRTLNKLCSVADYWVNNGRTSAPKSKRGITYLFIIIIISLFQGHTCK